MLTMSLRVKHETATASTDITPALEVPTAQLMSWEAVVVTRPVGDLVLIDYVCVVALHRASNTQTQSGGSIPYRTSVALRQVDCRKQPQLVHH